MNLNRKLLHAIIKHYFEQQVILPDKTESMGIQSKGVRKMKLPKNPCEYCMSGVRSRSLAENTFRNLCRADLGTGEIYGFLWPGPHLIAINKVTLCECLR